MKRYLFSLLNAAISGVATGVAANSIFHGTWKQDVAAAAISAIVSAAKWYLQHQPPGIEEDQK